MKKQIIELPHLTFSLWSRMRESSIKKVVFNSSVLMCILTLPVLYSIDALKELKVIPDTFINKASGLTSYLMVGLLVFFISFLFNLFIKLFMDRIERISYREVHKKIV